MSKFTKDVLHSSSSWWEATRSLAEQVRAAFLHKVRTWASNRDRALNRLTEKRDKWREDLYW